MKAILAPLCVEFGDVDPVYSPELKYIASTLASPIDPNHMPRHPSLGKMFADQASQRAEIYCFAKETADIIYSMMHSKRRAAQIFRTVRFPFPRMFFEYDEGGDAGSIRVGLYVEGTPDCFCMHRIDYLVGTDPFVSCSMKDVCMMNLGLGPLARKPIEVRHYKYPDMGFEDADGTRHPFTSTGELLKGQSPLLMLHIIAAFCVFLTLGGACVIAKKITREGRKARRRGRTHAMGSIDSYNSVTLKLPRRSIESDSVHFKRGPGVRWHRVAGHWREYSKNEQRVLGWMTYIANYERGDPSKGIIIKERDIVAA